MMQTWQDVELGMIRRRLSSSNLIWCALWIGAALCADPALAQMIQQTPPAAAVESLNQNLSRLAKSPQDVEALIGAGQAALDLGDVQAANGFFTRADLVAPSNARAKLGLAIVNVALKQPTEAATYFDAAEALGEHAQAHLSDRALAYDLTGQQAKAQRDYVAALAAHPDDEETRLRYAVSLGISGQIAAAEKQLEGPLAAGDREAWRCKALILAMNGKQTEARKIAQTVMPKGFAEALDPYLERIAMLPAGKKAAAVHYGEFPSDMSSFAAAASSPDAQLSRANVSTKKSRRNAKSRKGNGAMATIADPAPPAAVAATVAPGAAAQPERAGAPSQESDPARRAPAFTPASPRKSAKPTVQASGSGNPVVPSPAGAARDISGAAGSKGSSVAQAAAPRRSLGDAIGGLVVPDNEKTAGVRPVDLAAVARVQDLRRKADEAAAAKAAAEQAKRDAATKAKAAADADAKAKAKAAADEKARIARNPSRIWLQIATGRDIAALGFDLRRMRRTYSDALGDQTGWTAEWGATRRLLVGPYPSTAKAQAAASKIKASGGDAFVWTSDAGEDVTKISGK